MTEATDELLAELETVLSPTASQDSDDHQINQGSINVTNSIGQASDPFAIRGIHIDTENVQDSIVDSVEIENNDEQEDTLAEPQVTKAQSDLSRYFGGADDDDFFASLEKSPNVSSLASVKDEETPAADDKQITVIRHRTISATSEPSEVDLFQSGGGIVSAAACNIQQDVPVAGIQTSGATVRPGLSSVSDYMEQEAEAQWMMDKVSGETNSRKPRSRVRFLDDTTEDVLSDQMASMPIPGGKATVWAESERRSSAWLPSESTRQVLAGVTEKRHSQASLHNTLDARFFTRPGLQNTDLQGDPIRNLLVKQCGEQAAQNIRQIITADQVTQDVSGVRDLINDGWYRPAIDLTGRLLTGCGQGFGKTNQVSAKLTPKSVQLWMIRLSLLIKTKQYPLAELEMSVFNNLDNPDMYYDFNPDQFPGRKGSMIPFSMRLLHAELPFYVNKSQDAFDRLYYIKAIIERILTNLKNGFAEDGTELSLSQEDREASLHLWQERDAKVLYSLLHIFVLSRDYSSAIEIVHQLMAVSPSGHKSSLVSLLGRIYMQLGDLDSASYCFDQSVANLDQSDEKVQARIALQKALVHMGRNNFDDAKRFFKECIDLEPSNALAVNNFAVCCLYLGQLHESIRILETLLRECHVHDILVFNLGTLYELESSRALHKKVAVLERLAKLPGDGVNIVSLKINT